MEPLEPTTSVKTVSRWIWLGCILLVIGAALHSADKPIAGGDTWVAMACGRYFLGPWAADQPDRTWQMKVLDKFGVHITRREPFSARSRPYNPDNPQDAGWVNQNWLTHVMFYKMKTFWDEGDYEVSKGENLIVLYKLLQAVLTALLAYWAARVMGAHPIIASACASFGILLSRSFIDLRPNVSSIFFAAIMILLLAYWKKGQFRALLWMIPVMIVWSNTHGGFIYAIMIFVIMSGGFLVTNILYRAWPHRFAHVSWRGYVWLLAGTAVVTIIPAIFSPFGLENLVHPLIIATGEDGKIWRDVIEWKPISDPNGFGNAGSYIVFLWILLGSFITWLGLFFARPSLPQPRKRRQRTNTAEMPWAKIDLAQLGIIVITVMMSIKSRRFIFLGGVVLAPFLAAMAQQIINMVRVLILKSKQKSLALSPMKPSLAIPLAVLSLLAGVAMTIIFSLAMHDIYYRPSFDREIYTPFRKMVGINAQPVQAMKFFDANKITGVVFNEWTNGGFVAFGQKPQSQTGQPLCKVYMDGRAQAAYDVSHFKHYSRIKLSLPPAKSKKTFQQVQRLAQIAGISPGDPELYGKLLNYAQKKPAFTKQLNALIYLDPDLLKTLCRMKLVNLIKQLGIKSSDPRKYDKLIERARKNPNLYHQLIGWIAGDAKLYDKIMENEGINIALLPLKKLHLIFSSLLESGNWSLVYFDGKDAILARANAPENKHLLESSISDLKYPDKLSRDFSIGYHLSGSSSKEAQLLGMQLLMSIESHFAPLIHKQIYNTGSNLNKDKELYQYFLKQRDIYKIRVDNEEDFGRYSNVAILLDTYNYLIDLSSKTKNSQDRSVFIQEAKHYQDVHARIDKESREGLLW